MESDNTIFILGVSCLIIVGAFLVCCAAFWVNLITGKIRNLELPDEGFYFGVKEIKKITLESDYYGVFCCVIMVLGSITISLAAVLSVLLLLKEPFDPHQIKSVVWSEITYIVVVYFLLALGLQIVNAAIERDRRRLLCIMAWPIFWLGKLFYPLVFVVRACRNVVLNILRLPVAHPEVSAASPEQISAIVERSSEAGIIEEEQVEMIQGVIDFSEGIVREVMTPRKDVVAVSENSSLEDIVQVFSKEQLSRILVIGDILDDVKGILILKDLLPFVLKQTEHPFDIKEFIRPPYTVSELMKTDDLLKKFKSEAVHFAIVMDEHGGVAGVVTVEDLLEEIVGEIFDEFDIPEEEEEVYLVDNGDFIVEGGALIDDLNAEYDFNFPKGEYDTIAGLVIDLLGKIPSEGESVECNGFTIKVESVSAHRIMSLRIPKWKKSEK